MHTLSVSMRHLLDKEYSMFLEEIRERTPTQALVDKVLSKCQISEDQVMDHVTDASTTILCSHVKQTKLYNDLIFHKLFPDSSCHVMTPVASNVNSDTSSQGSARLTAWLNEDKFQTLTKVAKISEDSRKSGKIKKHSEILYLHFRLIKIFYFISLIPKYIFLIALYNIFTTIRILCRHAINIISTL